MRQKCYGMRLWSPCMETHFRSELIWLLVVGLHMKPPLYGAKQNDHGTIPSILGVLLPSTIFSIKFRKIQWRYANGIFICRILIAKLELHLLAGLKSGDLYQHRPAFETLASHTHTAWCNQTIMRKGQWLRPSRTSPYSHILSCWVCIKPLYRTKKWWGARKGFWLSNKFSKDELSLLFFFCRKFQSIDFSKEEK